LLFSLSFPVECVFCGELVKFMVHGLTEQTQVNFPLKAVWFINSCRKGISLLLLLPHNAMLARYMLYMLSSCVRSTVVHPSHASIVSKCRITQTVPCDSPGSLVFWCKNLGEIPTGLPPTWVPYRGGVSSNSDFRPYLWNGCQLSLPLSVKLLMVVRQLLITPTVEICIQQLGRVEEIVWLPYDVIRNIEPLHRASLSAAAETLVRLYCMSEIFSELLHLYTFVIKATQTFYRLM